MLKRLLVAAALVVVAGSMVGASMGESASAAKKEKVTICHRTNAVKNPYRVITVSKKAVDGLGNNDHTHHTGPVATSEAVAQALKDSKIKWGDIIPPFDAFPGYNWTMEGQAIYNNGCKPLPDYCDPTQSPRGMSIKQWVPNGVRCVEPAVAHVCGELTGTITNSTPLTYDISWSEGSADYNFNTSLISAPVTFPEDYNGGSVEVFYWVVGAEADYVTDRNIPNFWEQNAASVTVDTDCVEPGRGGGTPTEPKEPTTPVKQEVASLPYTAGDNTQVVALVASAVAAIAAVGSVIAKTVLSKQF